MKTKMDLHFGTCLLEAVAMEAIGPAAQKVMHEVDPHSVLE